MGKLMKSTTAFAQAEDVGVIVDDLVFVFLKRLRISFLSAVQILQWKVQEDVMQSIQSPCRGYWVPCFFLFVRSGLLDPKSL